MLIQSLVRHGVLSLALIVVGGCAPIPAPSPASTAARDAILFERHVGGVKNLFLMDAQGTHEHPMLARTMASAYVQHADWSPNGRTIAFEVLDADGDPASASVWLTDVSGMRPQQVATCAGPPCAQYAYPSWSPDGRQIAMIRFDLYSDGSCCQSALVTRAVRPGHDGSWTTGPDRIVAAFTDADAVDRFEVFSWPTWVDENRIAFELQRFGFEDPYPLQGSGVAVVDAHGGRPRIVTPAAMIAGDPRWDRCRHEIAFASYPLADFQTTDQPSNLYTVRPDGSGLTQLTRVSVDGSLRLGRGAWTADGRTMFVTVARASDRRTLDSVKLATMPASGGRVTELGVDGAGPLPRPSPSTGCAAR